MIRLFVFMNLAQLAVCAVAAIAPTAEQLQHDFSELDRLHRLFVSTPQFGEKFWLESKHVADQIGPRVIYAIMEQSKKWRDEEGLVFVPVVALLPRKLTEEILRDYERSPAKPQRVWAHEFLIELNEPDVVASVRRFSG
jgi:hypothetical protein